RHFGRERAILNRRKEVYENARHQNPDRWSKNIRNWDPVEAVYLNPEPPAEVVLLAAA
ncbi:MAG: IS3 family transposase, partial [Geobacter sp.]